MILRFLVLKDSPKILVSFCFDILFSAFLIFFWKGELTEGICSNGDVKVSMGFGLIYAAVEL